MHGVQPAPCFINKANTGVNVVYIICQIHCASEAFLFSQPSCISLLACTQIMYYYAISPFTVQDEKIRELVACFGLNDWSLIASLMPGRSDIECCRRWDLIDPAITKGPWTKEVHIPIYLFTHQMNSHANAGCSGFF